jgi:glucosamine--fructose-6-phosphate aminotransferase (isomerizing)
MCGILGIIGIKGCEQLLFSSLKQIQNRGYDSAGICTINDSEFNLIKFASCDKETAIDKIKLKLIENNDIIGIAHTRWATHGEKSDVNAHPHIDKYENIALVHNGMIDNYIELKEMLLNNDYQFKSETDTEIIVNLISFFYNKYQNMTQAIEDSLIMLNGTFALCIINKNENNRLYCIKRGCPLLISINDNFCMISSETSGFINDIKNYISIDDNDLCIINYENNIIKITSSKKYQSKQIKSQIHCETPYPYEYWLEKEILEQVDTVQYAMENRILNGRINFTELIGFESKIKKLDNIILLGCGTSYNASLISANFLKENCNFNSIQIFDGAEFYETDIPKTGKTGLILLSQSGETKDLHRCLELAKKLNLFTIGIINVVDSLIAREVDVCLYLNCGREISVASTKSFTSQIVVMILFGLFLIQNEKDISNNIENLLKLSKDIKITLTNTVDTAIKFAKYLFDKNSMFIIGKSNFEFIAKESSLKIKEIAYLHSEGYSSSSLKHGSYALLNPGFPVIVFCPDDIHIDKNKNVIEEIKSRKAFVLVITDNTTINIKNDNICYIPKNKFNYILFNIPVQLIGLELAKLKGHNPDMPRNLAKVVTVD